jgi:hypothetical protein
MYVCVCVRVGVEMELYRCIYRKVEDDEKVKQKKR